MERIEFDEWLRRVDVLLVENCGRRHDQLSKGAWKQWHSDGLSPELAAERHLENIAFDN